MIRSICDEKHSSFMIRTVLANIHVIEPVIFYGWARQDLFLAYVSLWFDGNQSDIVLFLDWRLELIVMS
jgi:hypothetical protein